MSDGKLLHSEKKIFRFLYIFLWRGGRQCGGGQCVKLHADKSGQAEGVGKHVLSANVLYEQPLFLDVRICFILA